MTTTNDTSGNHPLPTPEPRGLVVEVKHIVAVAAFLGLGGVGAGVVTVGGAHAPAPAPPEMVTALAEINAKLTVLGAKLDNGRAVADDHEARIRALEKRLK